MLKKTTKTVKEAELRQNWFVVDVSDKVLGRAATKIANLLLGKGSSLYSPHLASGGFVAVTNSKYVKVTGKKESAKSYYRYSGYPGGLKVRSFKELAERKPEEIIRRAVWGMLPKNRLGRKLLSRLHIYPARQHLHNAQKPVEVEV